MTVWTTYFGQPLTSYGLLTALALLGVLVSTGCWGKRFGFGYGATIRFAVLAVPLCLVVSRLVFVLASASYYLEDIGDASLMLHFWDGGYSMMGALAGLVLAGWLAETWSKLAHGALLDALALSLPLGLVIARLAEAGTGLGEGGAVPAGWPDCFTIDTTYGMLHTVFHYEAIAAVVILVVLCIWQQVCPTRRKGDVLLLFLLLFGSTQVVMESLRSDGHMTVHMGIAVQEVLAAALMLVPLGIWTARAASVSAHRGWWIVISWLLALVLMALAVVAEFGVDRWDSKLAAYGLMVFCLFELCELAGFNRRYSCQKRRSERNGARKD